MFRKVSENILLNTALIHVRTSTGESAGTGFLVDKNRGYLLTCSHVVGDANDGYAGMMRKNLPYDAQEFVTMVRNPNKDLALIRLKNVPKYLQDYPELKVNMEKDDFGLGKSVAICGFPRPDVLKGSWVTSGIISAIRYPKQDQCWEFQVNVSVLPGNSGGPVFTSDGFIIGMIKATTYIDGQILPYSTALHISEIFSSVCYTMNLNFGWVPVSAENVSAENVADAKIDNFG